MTMVRPTPPVSSVPDRRDRLRVLGRELERLLATADRSDPLDETVLCLVESAVRAAQAAERVYSRSGQDIGPELHDVLGAARAAVVTAGFALREHTGT